MAQGYAAAFWGPKTWARSPTLSGKLVCVGSFPNVMVSSDGGVTWSIPVATPPNDRWVDVCYSQKLGMFLAVSSSAGTTSVMYSTSDGATWTVATTPSTSVGWSAVAWSPSAQGGCFCAVDQAGAIITSTNGSSWTSQTGVGIDAFFDVCWADTVVISGVTGAFIAIGGGGSGHYVMTSHDGATWANQSPATIGQWGTVSWSNDQSVATVLPNVGGGGSSGTEMYSTDATTWHTGTSAQTAVPWASISWGKAAGVFVAVSVLANYIQYSGDGQTWSQSGISYSTAKALNCTCWSDKLGKFVAIGSAASGAARVQLSTDGKTWSSATTVPSSIPSSAVASAG